MTFRSSNTSAVAPAYEPDIESSPKDDDGFVSNFDAQTATTTPPSTAINVKPRESLQGDRDGSNRNKKICIGISCCCCCVVLIVIILVAVLVPRGRGGGGSGGFIFARGGRGGGGGYACFPGSELVQLQGGDDEHSSLVVPVKDLEPGSVVREGGLVTAVFQLLPAEDEVLYRYNHSAWVTGMHAVFEHQDSDMMMFVQDSELAQPVVADHVWNPSTDHLYNVVTHEHRVVINGTMFSDWEEEDFCSKHVLRRLNHPYSAVDDAPCTPEEIDEDPSDPIDEGSFQAGTMVSRKGTGHDDAPIESLRPGDDIQGGFVVGIVKVYQERGGAVYRYSPAASQVTKWTIVKDRDGVWRYVQDSPDAAHVRDIDSGEVFYQLITSNHRIVLADGTVFSDYEVLDEDSNDSVVVKYLRGVFEAR